MIAHPILFEVNTRCWLNELSAQEGAEAERPNRRRTSLAEVPQEQFAHWKRLGFTHIWLMGIWKTGPRGRASALQTPEQRQQYSEAVPDFREADVEGSPYAIADYSVSDAYGGNDALAQFRGRLHQHGLKLILDFVPNHLGLDHQWLYEQPDLFVQSPSAAPGTFQQETSLGTRWLAHGKDPYFPPWIDTVQVDYRRRATHQAMLDLLARVAEQCDGVRCDMAMLILNDVFGNTWKKFPTADPEPNFEFWQTSISAIKAKYPEFLFLAEAYWGLEPRLQSLGFDYTYDKELYDRVLAYDGPGVQRHLLKISPQYLRASAHFLENHDERRVASALSFPQHRAAAMLMLALPGMRFLHEGQLTGARRRVPVHLARRMQEARDPEITSFYDQILTSLPKTWIGRGEPSVLTPQPASNTDSSWEKVSALQWTGPSGEADAVLVNLSGEEARCAVALPGAARRFLSPLLSEVLGSAEAPALSTVFKLPPHGVEILRILPR